MAKTLSAKVGEFTNQQGETKGQFTRIGVLMQGNDGGEFLLLDPTVNIAGCLTKQNMLNHKNGKPIRDSLLVSIYDNSNQKTAPNQTGNQAQQQSGGEAFDDDIPFMSLNPLIKSHII